MDFKSAMQAFAEAWTAANAIKVNKNPSGNEADKDEKEDEEIGLQSDEKVRILSISLKLFKTVTNLSFLFKNSTFGNTLLGH